MDRKLRKSKGRLYAVFGKPVLHSKSPQLFSPLLYPEDNYMRIRPQAAGDLISIMKFLKIEGASITSPFKEEIIHYLDKYSEAASVIGAVNCICRIEDKLVGDNTDHLGVTGALQESGLTLEGARVLVLGAGGAAKAAVYGLARAGAEVFVSNRTQKKAEALAQNFGATHISWSSPGRMPYFDAVVSALLPEAMPPFAGFLSYGCLLDAVYKPSKMSYHSMSCGKKIIPGERWLIHQGIAAADFYVIQNNTNNRKPEISYSQKVKSSNDASAAIDSRVNLMESKLGESLSPDDIRILVLNKHTVSEYDHGSYDLIVSGFGLDKQTIKSIIDEEKRLAFGC